MKKKSMKLISALGAASFLCAGFAFAYDKNDCGTHSHAHQAHKADAHKGHCHAAMFAANGSETRKITIGGFVQVGYQNIWAQNDTGTNVETAHFNNFLLQHVRLSANAELGGGWSGYMNVDFAGLKSAQNFDGCACKPTLNNDASPARLVGGGNRDVYLHNAYIQKVVGDHRVKAGYKKVDWGAEENTPEAMLKAIERSTTTNFFTKLGSNNFGARHIGVFLDGDFMAMDYMFHYSAAVVNGYQGECCFSEQSANELSYYGSLSHAFMVRSLDLLIGVNAGYAGEGNSDPTFIGSGSAVKTLGRFSVWGFNPYLFAQFQSVSLMAEFYWTSIDCGAQPTGNDAHAWGINLLPSFMVNEHWEIVGRFSHLDTDCFGTTMTNVMGCLPDCDGSAAFTSTAVFDKVTSWYIGLNYYLMNKAVKASIGYEGAAFCDRYENEKFCGEGADAYAIRAALQLVF